MDCPHCNKQINALTGLQEVQKFQKHLRTCKKNPDRITFVNDHGRLQTVAANNTLLDVLNKRAESGQ